MNSIVNGLLKVFESNKKEAVDVQRGVDTVVKEQLKDEAEKATRAKEVAKDVRRSSDDDLDDGMRSPDSR